MKFYSKHNNHQNITGRSWNMDDCGDMHCLLNEYLIGKIAIFKDMNVPQVDKIADTLSNVRETMSTLHEYKNNGNHFPHDGWQYLYNGDIAYIDRGKDKTIVTLSTVGIWVSHVTEHNHYSHQSMWLADHPDYDDFNIISFNDDLSRINKNPMAYPSYYYNGVNEELNSLEALRDITQQLFPNSKYYIFSDCKTGHAGAVLAAYLDAKKCLIHSGTTIFDPERLWEHVRVGQSDHIDVDYLFDIMVPMYIRGSLFNRKVPREWWSTKDIVKNKPQTDFMYAYCTADDEYRWFIDDLEPTNNLTLVPIEPSHSVVGNHFILPVLKKKNIIRDFFRE